MSHTKETVLSQGNLISFVHLRDSNLSAISEHNLHSITVNLEKAMEKRKRCIHFYDFNRTNLFLSLNDSLSVLEENSRIINVLIKELVQKAPQLLCQTKPCLISENHGQKSWNKFVFVALLNCTCPAFFLTPHTTLNTCIHTIFLYSNIV